jgi:cyanuric acid amidohydrolase
MTLLFTAYDNDGPGDARALERLLAALPRERVRRLAVLGKTEGTATLNDFSRELAIGAATGAIARTLGAAMAERAALVFSTGCEGVITPFGYLIAELADAAPRDGAGPARLALGVAATPDIALVDRGGRAHALAVAAAVRQAMADAGATPEQVALVFVKSPVLPRRHLADLPPAVAARAGSTPIARAVAALGAGIALGEVEEARVTDAAIGRDGALHSRRAMCFSGTELSNNEIILLANVPGAGGDLVLASEPLADILDAPALLRLARRAGLAPDADGLFTASAPEALFLKVGMRPGGMVRGRRTTVFESDLEPDKHMRPVASGLVGALFGTTRSFISGGSEQQAPPGGGLAAMVVRAR